MKESNDNEQKILRVLEKSEGRSYTKKIAENAGMNPATASKYLMSLEAKGVIVKDDSQRPHIYWEILTKAKV